MIRPASTASTIVQKLVATSSEGHEKRDLLRRLIRGEAELNNGIIFCNRKRDVALLQKSLASHGFNVAALHGDMDQRARTIALDAFRSGEVPLLVASDVAARGLDIPAVSHVFNFDIPRHPEDYVHRIGRTGRAGKTGIAVTLVDWDDLHRWALINKALDLGIPEPEETYSSSEHLFEDLEIPANATGSLPKSARTREGLDAERVEDLGETGRGDSHQRGERRPRRDDERGRSGGRGGRSGGRGGERQASGGSSERRPRRDAASTEGSDGSSQPRRRRRRTRGGAGEAPAAD